MMCGARRSAVTILFLGCAASSVAQVQSPPSVELLRPANPAVFGQIDFGGRFTTVSGDQARYQRYRDLREGPFVDIPMYHRESETWWTTLKVRNAGYRDQRYELIASWPGRVKLEFLYDNTPTFISNDTATPYSPLPGDNGAYDGTVSALRLPDDVQTRIQNDRSLLRTEIEGLAEPFPSRIRRDSLGFDVRFDLTEAWRTQVKYLSTKKRGSIPWGASFGFSMPIEIALPIDTRTDDVGASLEWSNSRSMFRVGYDGSWFDQGVPVYIWDNPLRITDQTYSSAYSAGDGTSQGRGTQWPSNSVQYVTFAAASRLPSRTSLNGTVSLGRAGQNEALVPHTINTAIPGLDDVSSLDRLTADTKANLSAATVNMVTRPLRDIDISARYRFSQYANKSLHFERENYVRFDQVEEEGRSPLFHGYTRNDLDLDLAYSALRYTTLKVGYGYARADFPERVYFKNHDHALRASVDVIGNQYVSFRSLYEHSRRRGDGLHEEVLEEAGEQPGMRHYDVADRDRDQVTILTNLTLTPDVGVNASIGWTKDEYLNPEEPREDSFGLLNYKTRTYAIGVDYVPLDSIGVGLSYSHDKYTGLSQLRNASPGSQFTDPTRNWTTDEDQRGHSLIAYVDLLKAIPNTEARLSYDYSKYNGMYVYETGPGYSPTPDAPGGVAQLPELTTNERRFSADLRFFVRRDVAIGFAYWYDDYRVTDFTLGPPGETFIDGVARPPIDDAQPPDSSVNGVVLSYVYRPYTSHTAWARLTYLW